MSQAKGAKILLSHGCKPDLVDGSKPFNPVVHQSAIGSLLYLANTSRPDIAYAVNVKSQKNQQPSQQDYNEVKHIMRHLQQTKELSLILRKTGSQKKGSLMQIGATAQTARVFRVGTTNIAITS